MLTVTAWIVDVFKSEFDYQEGNVAWTEIYENEEDAYESIEQMSKRYLFYHFEMYEDEVDLWEDDIFFDKGECAV